MFSKIKFKCLAIVLVCFALIPVQLGAQETLAEPKSAKNLFKTLKYASPPSRFFTAPTSRILRTMEVTIAVGSTFGITGQGGLYGGVGLGLGDVAEVEFNSTEIFNGLTGKAERFPTRLFKVGVIPERFTRHWYVPNLAVQLRTTTWGKPVDRNARLTTALASDFSRANDGASPDWLEFESRFTTLYLVAGKEGALGGLHLGWSITDIRTKAGSQWIVLPGPGYYDLLDLPELKRTIAAPYGGLVIRANDNTLLMAEIEPVPKYYYDVFEKKLDIRRTWLGIAGVRFFLLEWLTWDTAVRYRSDSDGIADSEINVMINMNLPLKRP